MEPGARRAEFRALNEEPVLLFFCRQAGAIQREPESLSRLEQWAGLERLNAVAGWMACPLLEPAPKEVVRMRWKEWFP